MQDKADKADKSKKAFRELIRVLEDAIQTGADSVGMEYEDRTWIVYHNFGNTGLGAARIAKELKWDVINEIHNRAGLSRKARGTMRISLLGKDYEVDVKTHESFGETVYKLTLKERQEKEAAPVQKKKKKKPTSRACAPIRWEFDPDMPTHDFLEEDALDNLDDTVHFFVDWLEADTFLTWEAVMCEEQDLPLNSRQKKALGNLLSFSDEDDDDEILYINEIARPSEPWYVILNKIVPHLLVEPFCTIDGHCQFQSEGWQQIASALQEHGQGLSLPPGAQPPEEVVPTDLRHKLWLQFCFNNLDGLGYRQVTLENPDEMDRVDDFITNLRECKESVAYLGLTLESLMTRVILPEKDKAILVKTMQDKLGMSSAQEPIANHL